MNIIQLKRQSWNLAIIFLALVLGLWRISQLPQFGAYEARTFVLGILPIALLSMGQAIIIIGGGINLAIGAEAVLINCLSAKYMQDTTFTESVILAIVFLLVGMLIGALTGWIIAVSGIADIVVTLATSFLLVGVAMYVMPQPGGGVNQQFADLVSGKVPNFIPPLMCLILPIILIWIPLYRSKLGISMYAIGSSKEAAFLSGVNVKLTKIKLYAIGGLFAFAAIAVIASKILPRVLKAVRWERDLFLIYSVSFGLVLAALGTVVFDIPMALAGFIAGLTINQSRDTDEVRKAILPFRDLFAVLFFVVIGTLIQPSLLSDAWPFALLILVLMVLLKSLPTILIAKLGKMNATPFHLGIGVSQIGEFSFVLGSVAYSQSAITLIQYTGLLLAVVISITASTILVRRPKVQKQ